MTYQRELRKVTRKHPNTTRTIEWIVSSIQADGLPASATKIPNLGGMPVYKMRTRIGRAGKRRGRLVFHYENGKVTPLFIYFKGDREDVTPVEIIEALRAADLTD